MGHAAIVGGTDDTAEETNHERMWNTRSGFLLKLSKRSFDSSLF
jgi:hypothetical protein